jgi:predicted glycosyl hydrolase (DUF1957 family)
LTSNTLRLSPSYTTWIHAGLTVWSALVSYPTDMWYGQLFLSYSNFRSV